jgi:formyl-CoA transferase
VNAVLAALFHRERTGVGQYVEVPMLETITAFVLAEHLGGLTFEPSPAPAGYQRLLKGGRKPVPTKDGHIAMLPYTADHWIAFLATVGRDDLAKSLAVEDRHQRNANIHALYSELAQVTPQRTTKEWLAVCRELDIPASAIHTLDELPYHPQLEAVGFFQMADHPTEGRLRIVRPTTKFAATPASVRALAPVLGQHSRAVLAEAGYGESEIDALISAGIVIQYQERT